MSRLGRRLAAEREIWRAIWRQMETFLDRIEASADEDAPHVETMCALFPVVEVIENARQRSVGYRLAAPLRATPGGADAVSGSPIAFVGAATLTSGRRVPGVEDCEFAVASYRINGDGEIDDPPWSFLSRSVTLARFRDEKHGEVVLRTPSYDFGDLTGAPMVEIDVGDAGLFPRSAREEAMNGGEAKFRRWQDLRNDRVAAAKGDAGSEARSLSARLFALAFPPEIVDLVDVGATARAYARQCRLDAGTLTGARAKLAEIGVEDKVTDAITNAASSLDEQARVFDEAADQLSEPAVRALSYGQILAVGERLAVAEGAPGLSGLPAKLEPLDAAAGEAMNQAVQSRIGYPDGPLRQLRMMQGSLRFFWEHRTAWMKWRHDLVLAGGFAAYMRGFTQSLANVLAGGRSGLPLPEGSKLGRETLVGATELPLASLPDLSALAAGQIVVVGGDRPTAAPVVGVVVDGKKLPPLRLKVPSLVVSVATGAGLPGTPGLLRLEAPLADRYRRLDDSEVLRAANRDGPAGDGVVQALVAHRSRLALVLGDAGGGAGQRPAPPAMKAPYAGIARFDLEGTITPADNRLFLKALPAASASGTGELLPIARPGEMMLLYGRDAEGSAWQTAVEIDRVVVATGAEARRDEQVGATPVPPCCADEQPVMVVYIRGMQLPGDLTDAFLHRSFAGFGARSLMTGVVLPEALDPDTSSAVQVGAETLRPRRDPELRAALRAFEEWLPNEAS